MYSAFIAWICNGSSIAPLSDYAYIDLRRSKGHTGEFERVNCNDSDLTIKIELKKALTKKMSYQGEYMDMLGNNGLIMNYMEYGVKRESKV